MLVGTGKRRSTVLDQNGGDEKTTDNKEKIDPVVARHEVLRQVTAKMLDQYDTYRHCA
jgi:hypothetical protein